MGLDLVVLAKGNLNPTDAIGARRADRNDTQVMEELRRIWNAGDQTITFDAFVDDAVSGEVPPIVIAYGEDFESAKPAVQAEVQYYGYRGKSIEPGHNRVAVFAEDNGHDMSWLYGELVTQAEIESTIGMLQQTLDEYLAKNTEIAPSAREYYQAWLRRDAEEPEEIVQLFQDDPEAQEHVFELFSFFGVIDWLRFWADKGFIIKGDF